MEYSIGYWIGQYEKNKHAALCLDIETDGIHGPITVVGLYQPKDGPIEHSFLVNGRDLTIENLKRALIGCRMLITFNGIRSDIPKLRSSYPSVLPDNIAIIDLYYWSLKLGIGTSLKVLEGMFDIFRIDEYTKRRHIATKLWRRWRDKGDRWALAKLIEYNRQDTINLYPLATSLSEYSRRSIRS